MKNVIFFKFKIRTPIINVATINNNPIKNDTIAILKGFVTRCLSWIRGENTKKILPIVYAKRIGRPIVPNPVINFV